MVDSDNMTGPNIGTYYSSVMLICFISTVVFLSELNKNETLTGDTSNSYLTARTTEKNVFNSGPKLALFVYSGHLPQINTVL